MLARSSNSNKRSLEIRPLSKVVGEAVWQVLRMALKAGQYQDAEKALDEAEQITLRDFGPRHVNYASVLQMRAKVEREQGRPRQALPPLLQAVDILRSIPNCPGFVLATALSNFGFACQAVGQYHDAEKYFEEARELTRSSSTLLGRQSYTAILANLSELFNEIGQDERAEPLLVEALDLDRKLYKKTHPELAVSINNLGVFRMRHGDAEEGARLFQEAQEIIAASLGTHSSEYAKGLSTLARVFREMRLYEKAEAHCLFALDTLRKSRPEQSPEIAGTLMDLALVYACRGKFGQAEGALRNAVRIFEATLPADHNQTTEARFSLFAVLAAQQKTGDAFPVLAEAVAAESGVMDTILRLGSEKDRLAYLSSLQWHVEAALAFVVQCGIFNPTFVEWAFELICRRRGLAAEALSVQRDIVHISNNNVLKSKLERLNAIKMEIAHQVIRLAPNGVQSKAVADLQEERASLERELADAVPEIGLKLRLQELDWRKVAATLPASAVLVEFVRYPDWHFPAVMARNEKLHGPHRYAVFVLVPGEPPALQLIDLGEAAPIESTIADFRACLTGEDTRGVKGEPTRFSLTGLIALIPSKSRRRAKQLAELGQAVAKVVIDPIRGLMEGKKTIIIVPDGQLFSLPFECLPEEQSFWLDRRQIIYLGTSRELLSARPRASSSATAPMVIADPDYDLRTDAKAMLAFDRQSRALRDLDWRFSPLKGTHQEGNEVAKILGVRAKMGADASVSAIKQARTPRILHIATHGFFSSEKSDGTANDSSGPWAIAQLAAQENPMLRSGLALAGANSFLDRKALPPDAEFGILTAEDVTGLNLQGTELVVLSACDTGLGDVVSGEGVFGFRRAFGLAGARMLIVSLWKVADAETRELMQLFYQQWLQGEPAQTALQNAKLKIRERHPDPFFWAAFICSGHEPDRQKERELREQMMDLPKEFFTPQSATTLTGAAGITYVVAGTVQSAFRFNPRWLALLIAVAVAQFGVWYVGGGLADHVFGVLNGCLIYLTAVGISSVTGQSSANRSLPPRPTRGTFEGSPKTRGFFTNWW